MNSPRNIDTLLDRVSLFDLRSYLERAGWDRTIARNKKWQIFRLGDESSYPLELVLPAESWLIDVRERISQAISSISQIEERSAAAICADIVGTNADSLLIRLFVTDDVASIPILNAARHVKAIRNLLLYSACSEIQAKPHYEQPLPKAAELLSSFEFCHTFHGSFGFEVSNTLAAQYQVGDLFDSPTSRKIVERIARGMLLLDQSIRQEEPKLLIDSYESALNARMCDALADIGLDGEVEFEFGIDWASSVTPAEDVTPFREQRIGEPQVNMLKFVAEQLKIVEPHLERVQGQVVNLHCAANPVEGSARRTVAVKTDHAKHGFIEVRISLGAEYYQLAIDAHSKGKQLSAMGQLQRRGSTWTLDAITSLNVVDG